jgi:hypothetical protein
VIAGSDDAMAICSGCGDLMLRLNEALFTTYYETPKNFEEA